MFESFDSSRNRYASVGVVSSLPDELIDSIWFIIDLDLKGVIPLENILTFDLIENRGKVTMHFSQAGSNVEMDIDLPFAYSNQFPAQVYAYDDGTRETILYQVRSDNIKVIDKRGCPLFYRPGQVVDSLTQFLASFYGISSIIIDF